MHKVDNNKQTIDKRDFGVGTMPSFLLPFTPINRLTPGSTKRRSSNFINFYD